FEEEDEQERDHVIITRASSWSGLATLLRCRILRMLGPNLVSVSSSYMFSRVLQLLLSFNLQSSGLSWDTAVGRAV
ncbi:hypothetical protein LINGRAPRIM_LOCUS957, partial [Linum grandiflorum]